MNLHDNWYRRSGEKEWDRIDLLKGMPKVSIITY